MIPYDYPNATTHTYDTYQGTGTRETTIIRECNNMPLGWSAASEPYVSPFQVDVWKERLQKRREKELREENKIVRPNYESPKRVIRRQK